MARRKERRIKPYRFVLGRFGLGPGSDVSRTTPSRGVKFSLWAEMMNVRLGLIPHFALGSIADVSNPASAGGDSLVLRMGDVNGWFEVRGFEISDICVTSPSCGMIVGVTGGATSSVACGQPRDVKRSAVEWGNGCENGKRAHMRLASSGTDSMPSEGIRLAPRPRSWLSSRFSGPREVDEGRMLPSPPLPN